MDVQYTHIDLWLLDRALLVYSDDTQWKCKNQQKIWLSWDPWNGKRPYCHGKEGYTTVVLRIKRTVSAVIKA